MEYDVRIHVFSDLHREFAPIEFSREVTSGKLGELVLLAGDIDTRRRSVVWAAETFEQSVVMVGGNHEAYGDTLFAAIANARNAAQRASSKRSWPVHYLERETCILSTQNGSAVRVVGATLWTDFCLHGASNMHARMDYAAEEMNDYVRVKIRDRHTGGKTKFTPQDSLDFHIVSRRFIETELSKPFDGYTIVLTHHAPSARSLPRNCDQYPEAAAYASSLDHLIEALQPDLWVHGHIHHSSNYAIGKTRVICNPRGYIPYDANRAFDPAFAIELK